MRLSGDAAIVGIAELPAERRQTRPELFTLDQYAALAKAVVDDAGLDASVVNGLLCHGVGRIRHVRSRNAFGISGATGELR